MAGVDPVNVDKAIPLIQAEIKRMIETKVTPTELKDNKSYMIGSMPIGLETNDGVAGITLDMELYGLGLDYLVTEATLPLREVYRNTRFRIYALKPAGPAS